MNGIDFTQIRNAFGLSHHRFIKMLANGITDKFQKIDDSIETQLVGKEADNAHISVMFTGIGAVEDIQDVSNRVDEFIQELKNTNKLMSILKEDNNANT